MNGPRAVCRLHGMQSADCTATVQSADCARFPDCTEHIQPCSAAKNDFRSMEYNSSSTRFCVVDFSITHMLLCCTNNAAAVGMSTDLKPREFNKNKISDGNLVKKKNTRQQPITFLRHTFVHTNIQCISDVIIIINSET